MNSELVEDILNFKPEPKIKTESIKEENVSERIIKTQDFQVSGIDLFVGQRVRMKENFNRLKEHQLVEILGVNKNKEIQVLSVYDGSKTYLTLDQIYFD